MNLDDMIEQAGQKIDQTLEHLTQHCGPQAEAAKARLQEIKSRLAETRDRARKALVTRDQMAARSIPAHAELPKEQRPDSVQLGHDLLQELNIAIADPVRKAAEKEDMWEDITDP